MTDTTAMQFDNPCLGRIVFGQRPTDRLHLGHLLGSIAPIIEQQPRYEMIILIADGSPGSNGPFDRDLIYEVAAAWLSAGLSPNETLLTRLSAVPEIEKLQALLTPYALQGLTVPTELYLEACTLIALQATHVPAHASRSTAQTLAADIVQKFNTQTGAKLPEPAWMPLPEAHLPGLDGSIMRTAAGNAILLGDSEEETLSRMLARPESQVVREAAQAIVNRLPARSYTSQGASPIEICQQAAEQVNEYLHSLRVKRAKWLAAPADLEGVLQFGSQRARIVAAETLAMVRRAIST